MLLTCERRQVVIVAISDAQNNSHIRAYLMRAELANSAELTCCTSLLFKGRQMSILMEPER